MPSKLNIEVKTCQGINAPIGEQIVISVELGDNQCCTPIMTNAEHLPVQSMMGFPFDGERMALFDVKTAAGGDIERAVFMLSEMQGQLFSGDIELEGGGTIAIDVQECPAPDVVPENCTVILDYVKASKLEGKELVVLMEMGDHTLSSPIFKYESGLKHLGDEITFKYQFEETMTVFVKEAHGDDVFGEATMDLWDKLHKTGDRENGNTCMSQGDLPLTFQGVEVIGFMNLKIAWWNTEEDKGKLLHGEKEEAPEEQSDKGSAGKGSALRTGKSTDTMSQHGRSKHAPSVVSRADLTSSSSSSSTSSSGDSKSHKRKISHTSTTSGEITVPKEVDPRIEDLRRNCRECLESCEDHQKQCDDYCEEMFDKLVDNTEAVPKMHNAEKYAEECRLETDNCRGLVEDAETEDDVEKLEEIYDKCLQQVTESRNMRDNCKNQVIWAVAISCCDEAKRAKRAAFGCRAIDGQFGEKCGRHPYKHVKRLREKAAELAAKAMSAATDSKLAVKKAKASQFPAVYQRYQEAKEGRIIAEDCFEELKGIVLSFNAALAKDKRQQEKKKRLMMEAQLKANLEMERNISEERHIRYAKEQEMPNNQHHEQKYLEILKSTVNHEVYAQNFMSDPCAADRNDLKKFQKELVSGTLKPKQDSCLRPCC